eukprot:TRINITY_DN1347_c0_g2_i1.p2 TRINITY_DN1347_c0_g2~~TRINITY_DN1347_c0_g2_i1.p2  ORF type:complete len:330 (+),score=97.25 TRINITY_DN1347_c0_g2_i1:52-1041(+)
MKSALLLLGLAAAATALPREYVEANEAALWASFKEDFRRTYSTAEEPRRRAIFRQRMLEAAELEAQSKTGARFGATKFSDMTDEELSQYRGLRIPQGALDAAAAAPKLYSEAEVVRAANTSIDWREKNAVTAVKNQARCGSCYSFSTTGAIEGQQAVAKGKLVSLSEQEIVSCSKLTLGCNGGWQDKAVRWLTTFQKGNIVTEEAYPYTSGGGFVPECALTASMEVGATVTGTTVLPTDEDQIAAYLIEHGPLAITIDASSWSQYHGGVLDTCRDQGLNHAVLAVGVTPSYWVVKNSWGASWGEAGYIRLARGQDMCGIAKHVVAPLIA